MIEYRDVGIAYGRRRLLEGVSLFLERGAFVGLVGPNGSGKTSLLRLAVRLQAPASGCVLIEGRDVADYRRRDLARLVAAVWQRPALAFGYTARQVIMLGRTSHLSLLRWESRHDEAIVQEALEETETDHLADRPASSLSAGELQRVFIAAAIVQQSRVLLLDEPTSQLDARQAGRLSAQLDRFHRAGLTILCASHDPVLLRRHTTSIVLLADGSAELLGPQSLGPHLDMLARSRTLEGSTHV
jgi:iron complex transport system ATP-binding protein